MIYFRIKKKWIHTNNLKYFPTIQLNLNIKPFVFTEASIIKHVAYKMIFFSTG